MERGATEFVLDSDAPPICTNEKLYSVKCNLDTYEEVRQQHRICTPVEFNFIYIYIYRVRYGRRILQSYTAARLSESSSSSVSKQVRMAINVDYVHNYRIKHASFTFQILNLLKINMASNYEAKCSPPSQSLPPVPSLEHFQQQQSRLSRHCGHWL